MAPHYLDLFPSLYQFFYAVMLALEAAVVGWYQPEILKQILDYVKEINREILKKIENCKSPSTVASDSDRIIKDLKRRQRINDRFQKMGKVLIVVVSLILMLACIMACFATWYQVGMQTQYYIWVRRFWGYIIATPYTCAALWIIVLVHIRWCWKTGKFARKKRDEALIQLGRITFDAGVAGFSCPPDE